MWPGITNDSYASIFFSYLNMRAVFLCVIVTVITWTLFNISQLAIMKFFSFDEGKKSKINIQFASTHLFVIIFFLCIWKWNHSCTNMYSNKCFQFKEKNAYVPFSPSNRAGPDCVSIIRLNLIWDEEEKKKFETNLCCARKNTSIKLFLFFCCCWYALVVDFSVSKFSIQ